MKKKSFILLVITLLLTLPLLPEEWMTVSDLTRPSTFIVRQDRAYILEEASIYVYSLMDKSLIKKFGKSGEGPGEFAYNPTDGRPLSMSFFNRMLIVNSPMKMSYFSPDGKFLKEERVKVDRLLFPVDDKFLGIGPTMSPEKKMFIGFTLYNRDFKSPKVIFLSDFEMGRQPKLLLPATAFTYNPVYKGRIYANVNAREFRIDVFDADGKKVDNILKNYPKIPVPSTFREKALDYFKTSPRYRNIMEIIRKILKVRHHYPPIRDLRIREDHIYALTFKRKGELWELIKMDLKGKELGRTFIKLSEYEYFSFYPIFFSIYKNQVYTLVENPDDEVWTINKISF